LSTNAFRSNRTIFIFLIQLGNSIDILLDQPSIHSHSHDWQLPRTLLVSKSWYWLQYTNLYVCWHGKLSRNLHWQVTFRRANSNRLKTFSIMYNLCKTIRIGRYAFTFDFYIHKEALIVEWLFESINPTRRISIEFNTSSFLLSYLDRLIGIEVNDIYNWKKNLICGYVLSMNDTRSHSLRIYW
jgi:hypothetical protein